MSRGVVRLLRMQAGLVLLGLAGPALAGAPRVLVLGDGALAYLPAGIDEAAPGPPRAVLVLLHGADHRNDWLIRRFAPDADARGFVILAPFSRGRSWDAVLKATAPVVDASRLVDPLRFSHSRDGDRVEAALAELGTHIAVDRSRTVLAGFSDGASFALMLGMSARHDFGAVIAWSPGAVTIPDESARGRRVFVSHGHQDHILSYQITAKEIVPALHGLGAQVTFRSFEGDHVIPRAVATEFLDATFGPAPVPALP